MFEFLEVVYLGFFGLIFSILLIELVVVLVCIFLSDDLYE